MVTAVDFMIKIGGYFGTNFNNVHKLRQDIPESLDYYLGGFPFIYVAHSNPLRIDNQREDFVKGHVPISEREYSNFDVYLFVKHKGQRGTNYIVLSKTTFPSTNGSTGEVMRRIKEDVIPDLVNVIERDGVDICNFD